VADLAPEDMRALDTRIRLRLLHNFIEHAWPLTTQELAGEFSSSLEQVSASLHRLHQRRALVLFPESDDVLMLHPFSAVPTAFRVEAEGRSWWASCAWCAFGIAALLGADTTIYTVCGSCQRPIQWVVQSGVVAPTTDVIHFAAPPRDWWGDLAGACKQILGFHSVDHAAQWSELHGRQGAIVSVGQVWQLAQAWFADLREPTPRSKTPEAMAAIFQRIGLIAPFWDVSR